MRRYRHKQEFANEANAVHMAVIATRTYFGQKPEFMSQQSVQWKMYLYRLDRYLNYYLGYVPGESEFSL